MEAVLEDAQVLLHREKICAIADLLPLLEKALEARQAAADHRRGRRGRGAVDAGGELHPQDVQGRRGQGAVLRRPPQGVHAGPRHRARREVVNPETGTQAGRRRSRGARQRAPRGGHQGHHHLRRRWRLQGRRRRPHRPDPAGDRGDRLRLGPREAPGAAGQARRRRRGHQGRRGHRDRDEGAQAPHRGRDRRHAGRRSRRASSPAAARAAARLGRARRRPRPHRRRGHGVAIVRRALSAPLSGSPATRGSRAAVVAAHVAEAGWGNGYDAADRRLRRPAWRPASSTRSR